MENKKYTTVEFIKKYNDLSNKEIKDAFVKSIIKRQYVPFTEKHAEAIIMNNKALLVEKGSNRIMVNSALRYFNFMCSILVMYTNLDFYDKDGKSTYDQDYDRLVESKLIYKIFDNIDPVEIKEYQNIYDSVYEDIRINSLSTEATLTRIENNINQSLKTLNDSIYEKASSVLDGVSNFISNLDESQINQFRDMLLQKKE